MVEAFQMMYSMVGVDVWAHPVVMLGEIAGAVSPLVDIGVVDGCATTTAATLMIPLSSMSCRFILGFFHFGLLVSHLAWQPTNMNTSILGRI